MNSIHDMGGMHGFGSIPQENNEPVFHDEWEARIFGINLLTIDNVPAFRFSLEKLDPVTYLSSSYYERWIPAKENQFVEEGIITREEIEHRVQCLRDNPTDTITRINDPHQASQVLARITTLKSPLRDTATKPVFDIGDLVSTVNINTRSHTRLPRYVRGKKGVITRFHGIHDFDDTVATSTGPHPQPVYNVRFEATELWGEAAEDKTSIYIDLWESYLVPTIQRGDTQ